MAASNTNLTSLWVDDVGGNTVSLANRLTPSKIVTSQTVPHTSSYEVIHVQPTTSAGSRVGVHSQQVLGQVISRPQVMQQIIPQVIQVKTENGVPHVIRRVKHGDIPQVIRQVVTPHNLLTSQANLVQKIELQSPIIQVSTPRRDRVQSSPHIVRTGPLDFGSPGAAGWANGQKRHLEYYEIEPGKRKKEKGGKGLRHFSMKVCEKVQRKGVTSYNEVADELVAEFADPNTMTAHDVQYDQKNIRRRVYDALNVLMAMNIISKEKKEIRWIGLPTNSAQECQNMEFEKRLRQERVRHKTQQLQELILQQISFKNLVQRNRSLEREQGCPSTNSAIQLPFIIVNTSKKTVIDCSISNDKYEYLFNFDNTFEIHDDIEVLKRMGMAFGLEKSQCSPHDLQTAVKMMPKALEPYVLELGSTPRSTSLASRSLITAGPSGHRASTSRSDPILHPSGSYSENSMDSEVENVTEGLSLNSKGFTRTPEDDYSDESASERSSPIDV